MLELEIVDLSPIVALISYILTKAYIFEGLRAYFIAKNYIYLAYIMNCPLCVSFWVSILVLWQYGMLSEIALFSLMFWANLEIGIISCIYKEMI